MAATAEHTSDTFVSVPGDRRAEVARTLTAILAAAVTVAAGLPGLLGLSGLSGRRRR